MAHGWCNGPLVPLLTRIMVYKWVLVTEQWAQDVAKVASMSVF